MKKTMKLLALLLAVLLTGCGAERQEQPQSRTICVLLKAMDSVHWMSVEDGLKQAASDYNVHVNVLWPEHESDVDTQNSILADVIASKPDAIAVAPCDSEHVETLQRAKQADIPCFYIDTRAEACDFPYIGSNNYQIGQLAAQKLAETLESGTVAVISGSQRQSTHSERTRGFVDYLRQESELTVCAVRQSPNSNENESMQCMKELLEEYPDLKGVFCTSAMMALGAMQQRDNMARQSVRLVGVDTQSDALIAVQDGRILALVGQNGYQIGYRAVEQIARALEGKEIPQETYVVNDLITRENVKEYLEEYMTERGSGS